VLLPSCQNQGMVLTKASGRICPPVGFDPSMGLDPSVGFGRILSSDCSAPFSSVTQQIETHFLGRRHSVDSKRSSSLFYISSKTLQFSVRFRKGSHYDRLFCPLTPLPPQPPHPLLWFCARSVLICTDHDHLFRFGRRLSRRLLSEPDPSRCHHPVEFSLFDQLAC